MTGRDTDPVITVRRGRPDDDELAAVCLVLLGLGAPAPTVTAPTPVRGEPASWTRRAGVGWAAR